GLSPSPPFRLRSARVAGIVFEELREALATRLQMVCVFIMNRVNSQNSGFCQRRRMALGIVILLLVDVIWVASSELTSSEPLYVPVKFHDLPSEKLESTNIGTEKTPKKSRVRFSNIMEIRQLPSSHALEAKLSRMSYPTVKDQESILKTVGKLTATQWFLANLSYQEALSDTQVAIVNILSSTSGLFTLILAAVFPSNSGDRFTLSKLLAVILSIGGVVLVNLSGSEKSAGRDTIGSIWSLAGAMLYAVYIVMIKRKVDREDKLDIPMFFGKGCFLTSSLIGTLALSLTIPLSIIADMCMQ
ncbi:hypothetical protein A6R68_09115, partial [Neotoma lepida]